MTRKRYEYMTIDIPSDCEDDSDKRFDLAILNARERFTIYRIPCNWRLVSDNGEQVKVCRESRRK